MPSLAERARWIAAVVLAGCCSAFGADGSGDYDGEIARWRAERVERLRSDSGWLTLVGLYWLEPGDNRFGADPSNEIVLPEGAAPAFAGRFVLEPGPPARVRVVARGEAGVTLEGEPVGERALRADDEGAPDVGRLGRLAFHVIRRGDRWGIRVKDPESPARTRFRGLEFFPPDPAYRVRAEFVRYDPPKKVEIPTVLGTTETMTSPGYVKFRLEGRDLTLEPVVESPSDPELFFIFRDATSGHETYPAGRFLYADAPKDGVVTLDFNKAYNPPCAFTPYATCPLPPPRNRLPLRIAAGEKNYAH